MSASQRWISTQAPFPRTVTAIGSMPAEHSALGTPRPPPRQNPETRTVGDRLFSRSVDRMDQVGRVDQ